MVAANVRAPNGEFYVSLTYQAMLGQGRRSSIYPLDAAAGEVFFPTGEPGDWYSYLYAEGGYGPMITGSVAAGTGPRVLADGPGFEARHAHTFIWAIDMLMPTRGRAHLFAAPFPL